MQNKMEILSGMPQKGDFGVKNPLETGEIIRLVFRFV